jgi:hypothetical protein
MEKRKWFFVNSYDHAISHSQSENSDTSELQGTNLSDRKKGKRNLLETLQTTPVERPEVPSEEQTTSSWLKQLASHWLGGSSPSNRELPRSESEVSSSEGNPQSSAFIRIPAHLRALEDRVTQLENAFPAAPRIADYQNLQNAYSTSMSALDSASQQCQNTLDEVQVYLEVLKIEVWTTSAGSH